ncbi:carboxypeptidase regulatory-like domain-containing protein [Ferruginibacter sp.]
MKKSPVLHINIPDPCSQNWDAMAPSGEGRQCSKCNTIIYDFSQMSDEELLQFFKKHPATHCGRFHNSQLNRDIQYPVKKKFALPYRFSKIAAAFFTLLSFRSSISMAAKKSTVAVEQNATPVRKILQGGKAVISGTVKDRDGKPLEKAVVMFDSIHAAITDAEGKFSFEMDAVTGENHHLYFSYEGLITVVRTYHPVMLSTEYNVILYKPMPQDCQTTAGIMLPFGYLGELPSLQFKGKELRLSTDNKAIIAVVADKLKANPEGSIHVKAYYTDAAKSRLLAELRVTAVRKYLVEQMGINVDRIMIVTGRETELSNRVDFLNSDQ